MSDMQDETHTDAGHGYHMGSGDETGRTYLSGPGFTDMPIEYVVTPPGVCLWGGCIDIGMKEDVEAETARRDAVQSAMQATGGNGSRGTAGDATAGEAGHDDHEPGEGAAAGADPTELMGVGLPTTSQYLWSNMVVPYTVASSVPNQGRINDAIAHIHAMTGMRLVRRTSQRDYIEIISNGSAGWSSSAIGRRGGRQLIRYADGHSWQILVHEFYHAFGVYHEQSRSDRDAYVEIKWNNIQDNAVGNFQKQPGSVDYYDYDYGSLMHYPGTSFAKDRSKPTIVPKRRGVSIGQRQKLSYGDRQTVAKMYERYRTKGYAGVWRAGTGSYALWVNASWSSFRSRWQQWSGRGLRLHDIHVRTSGGRTYYSGVYRPGSGSYGLWANVDWASFRNRWQQWSGQGLRLVDMNIHRSGNQTRYSGVYQQGGGGYGLWVNADWTSFRNRWQDWSARGLRLVDLDVSRVGGITRYSGVFLAGSGGHALWANASWGSFVSKWSQLSGQGLRLVDINLHQTPGGGLRYSGCFLPGNDAHYLWANVTWESFRAKWEELAESGLRLIDFEMPIPASGLADVADASIAADTGDDESMAEPFGGLFEPAEVEEEALAAAEQEDHGGMVSGAEIDDGAAEGDGFAQFEAPGAPPGANGASAAGTRAEDPRGDGAVYQGEAVH